MGLWNWTQTWGVVKAVGGGLEAFTGGAIIAGAGWTGAGAVLGAVMVAHGADTAQAGVRQSISGQNTRTGTSHTISGAASLAGASPQVATAIGEAGDAAIGLVGVGATIAKAPQLAGSLGTVVQRPAVALTQTTTGQLVPVLTTVEQEISIGMNAMSAAGQAAAQGEKLQGGDPEQQSKQPKEGRYEFPDKTANDKPYVGQSGNIPKRLKSHEAAGRLEPGTESATEVLGGKTAREISEHKRIQELTGGVPARQSDKVANKIDPIGPSRQDLLKDNN